MGSIVTKTNLLTRYRRLTQTATLVFLNLPFVGLLTVACPVFYCHGCPLASMACPIGVLVNFSTLRIFPFVTLGILGLVGVLGGRLVCGWLCPFGLVQDLLYKIRSRKIKLHPSLYYIKYVLLLGLVFAVPFFLPNTPYTFCHFCPSGTVEASIPWHFMGVASQGGTSAFVMRIVIAVAVLLFAVIASRSWCRMLCPLGAIFAFFNRFSILRFNPGTHECTDCGLCNKKCPVEIEPYTQMNTAECIRCTDCLCKNRIGFGVK